MDPEILDDPAIFPPEDVVANLEGAEDTSGNNQRIDIWEEFKSGHRRLTPQPPSGHAMTATTGTAPTPDRRRRGRGSRSGLLTTVLSCRPALWYLVLLVAPLAIVVIFSFGVAGQERRLRPGVRPRQLRPGVDRARPVHHQPVMAAAGTIGCLLVGLPLAYFIATRAGRRKGLLILLLVIPFWTSFLIRTYAWLIILGPDIGLAGLDRRPRRGRGLPDPRHAGRGADRAGLRLPAADGLPAVRHARADGPDAGRGSKDLGAGRWATFRQVTLPVALPGLVTGSILVFIPMMGEYVIPQILGYGRTFLMGNALVTRLPRGAQLAVGLGPGRRPDPDHVRHDHGLPVVREPRPPRPARSASCDARPPSPGPSPPPHLPGRA